MPTTETLLQSPTIDLIDNADLLWVWNSSASALTKATRASVVGDIDLLFSNGSDKQISINNSPAATVGRQLTVQAGNVASGTNLSGGNLSLEAGVGTGTGSSNLIFSTGESTGSATSVQTLTERMRITNSGKVGIGTMIPEARLNVVHVTSTNTIQYGGVSELDFTSTASDLNESFAFGATLRFRGISGNDSADDKGLSGFSFNTFNYNTGTVDYMQGMYGDMRNLSTGTITNLSGIRLPGGINSGGGTITNFYGLRVEAQSVGTNRYAISLNNGSAANSYNVYAGGTAQNYFAGNVGIGTASPSTRLDIDNGALELAEMTAPAAGAANTVRIYAVDNGGKTQLMALFSSGAAQQLAIQP